MSLARSRACTSAIAYTPMFSRKNIRNGKKLKPYVAECLNKISGPIIAASDYMKVLSDSLSKWVKEDLISLGTDGYGRSDDRPALRNHFEVDANAIIWSVLASLNLKGQYKDKDLKKAREELGIDINKPNPLGE